MTNDTPDMRQPPNPAEAPMLAQQLKRVPFACPRIGVFGEVPPAPATLPEDVSCEVEAALDDVLRMVHAFDDAGRKQRVREVHATLLLGFHTLTRERDGLAARLRSLEDAIAIEARMRVRAAGIEMQQIAAAERRGVVRGLDLLRAKITEGILLRGTGWHGGTAREIQMIAEAELARLSMPAKGGEGE